MAYDDILGKKKKRKVKTIYSRKIQAMNDISKVIIEYEHTLDMLRYDPNDKIRNELEDVLKNRIKTINEIKKNIVNLTIAKDVIFDSLEKEGR